MIKKLDRAVDGDCVTLSSRSPLLALSVLAALVLLAGCGGASVAAEAAPVTSSAPRTAESDVNGLAAEQEAEAARVVAEAEAARVAAEAEAARVAAEAEAEAARTAAQDAGAGRARSGGPSTSAQVERPAGGPALRPAPAAAPEPDLGTPSGDLLLSNMSCHFDGSRFILGFTATFESGHHYQRVDDYNSGGPFLSRYNGHYVLGGNFIGYGNCIE